MQTAHQQSRLQHSLALEIFVVLQFLLLTLRLRESFSWRYLVDVLLKRGPVALLHGGVVKPFGVVIEIHASLHDLDRFTFDRHSLSSCDLGANVVRILGRKETLYLLFRESNRDGFPCGCFFVRFLPVKLLDCLLSRPLVSLDFLPQIGVVSNRTFSEVGDYCPTPRKGKIGRFN